VRRRCCIDSLGSTTRPWNSSTKTIINNNESVHNRVRLCSTTHCAHVHSCCRKTVRGSTRIYTLDLQTKATMRSLLRAQCAAFFYAVYFLMRVICTPSGNACPENGNDTAEGGGGKTLLTIFIRC